MDTSKTSSAPQDSPLHFLDYWRIIRIRKTVILAVFLLVVLTTVGVTMMLKPTYSSTARIEIGKETKAIDPLGRTQVQQPYDPYFITTEFEKIQSSAVLYPVIERLRLDTNWARYYNPENEPIRPDEARQLTYQLLRRNMDVRQTRNSSLVEIRVFSRSPAEAAEIANAIAESYKGWRLTNRMEETYKGIEVLEIELGHQSNRVAELRRKLDDTRAKLSIPEGAGERVSYSASLEREMVNSLAAQLTYAQGEYVLYKSQFDRLRSLSTNDLRKAILTTFQAEEVLPKLLHDLTTSEQMLARLLQDYSPEHPEVKSARAVRDQIEQQVTERIEGMMLGLESRVKSLQERYEALLKRVEEGKARVAEEATQQREYYALKSDLEKEERVYDALYLRTLQEKFDAKIPAGQSIVAMVDKAEPGLRPVRPNLMLNLALGSVFGLVMGIGLAFFIEYLDTSVKTIDDVERALQAPVLGVIPQNVGLLLEQGPDSPHAESYRVLRTNVLFSRKRPDANSLTVVSGGAGEGKSTTIFNLATVFAQQGQRVLVVDSDLRRPSLHKFLKVSNSLGLTNYLLKQATLEEVIQTTKNPLLDFLPSGKLPSSSLGILNSQRMKDFIQDVKKRYDFVFFDSPPIMGVSDASILASEVDLAILVVQYRKYPQAMTLRAKQMVEKVGGTLLGVVLNNINISQDSYYYYYSGYYYDYYSKSSESEPEGKSAKPAKDVPKAVAAVTGAGDPAKK